MRMTVNMLAHTVKCLWAYIHLCLHVKTLFFIERVLIGYLAAEDIHVALGGVAVFLQRPSAI